MPGRYALLIGNSNFRDNDLARLSAPQDDVRALASLLEDSEIAGFDHVELKLDIDPYDGRAAIGRLYQDRHPDDVVLLYYSGHGLVDRRGRFYLAMTPTDPGNPDPGSIDRDWLRREMDESASRRQLTILDCCHSGALIPEGMTARDAATAPVLTAGTFDPTGHGRYIMAATAAGMSAFEQDGRSIYTRHLVEGLKTGAAAPEKAKISVHDLHEFVRLRVAEDAPDVMRPQLWRDAELNPSAGPLIVARNPKPRPKIGGEIVKDLWSSDHKAMEWAVFRLREIAERNASPLSDDARRLLAERLEKAETLPHSIGRRIASSLVDIPSAEQVAAHEARVAELETLLEKERTTAADDLDTLRLEMEMVRDSASRDREELQRRLEAAGRRIEPAAAAGSTFGKAIASPRGLLLLGVLAITALALSAPDAVNHATSSMVRLITAGGSDPDLRAVDLEAEVDRLRVQLDESEERTELLAVQVERLEAELNAARNTPEQCRTHSQDIESLSCFTDAGVPSAPEMIMIPGGQFMMGSPDDEEGRDDNEGPQREVAIAPFAIARTEVTFDQWDACVENGGCQSNPEPDDEGWGRGARPVINVSWHDAREYIAWLNGQVEGGPYRLPTEAQWEYAARATTMRSNDGGSTFVSLESPEISITAYPWGEGASHEFANYREDQCCSGRDVWAGETAPVASFPGNGFGLYDMHGNVWEWVEDCLLDYRVDHDDGSARTSDRDGNCDLRVGRGGSWFVEPRFIRSAVRGRSESDHRDNNLGFRPARDLPTP